MSVSVGITIKNLPQIRAAFSRAPWIVKPHINLAINKAILTIGRSSRQLTPVDTGRLRASHREVFRPMYGEVGTHVNYDIFVHEGTRYMQARPFMQEAVDQSDNAIQGFFRVELQQALDKIARML